VTVIATGFDQRLATAQRRTERPAAEPREEEAPAPEGDVLDIPAFLRRR
jgi:hypothetical protein